MKKIGAIVASAVVLLLVLGLPPVLGRVAEARVNARVAAISENPLVVARLVEFDRSWFSSRIKVELALSPSYIAQIEALRAMSGDPSLGVAELARGATILVDLAHGPVALGDGVYIGLSTMVARLDPETTGYANLLQRLNIPYLFEFRGRTSFTGRLAFDADVSPIALDLDDGGAVRLSGAVLAGTLSGNSIEYDMRVDSFDVDSGSGTFSVHGVSATGDNDLRSSYLMLGPVDAVIERVAVVDPTFPTAPAFEASNVRFGSKFELDESATLVNGEASYAIDSLVAPDIALHDARLGFAIRNLDIDGLEAYAEAVQQNAASGVVDPGQTLIAITPSVERLLRAQPSVAFSPLRFTFNGEPFDARLELNTRRDALPPAGALDLRDPALWVSLFDATLHANLSKNLARAAAVQAVATQLASSGAFPPDQSEQMAEAQASLMLVTLVGQGILIDSGQNYSTDIRFTNGTLTVNGNPMPIGLP